MEIVLAMNNYDFQDDAIITVLIFFVLLTFIASYRVKLLGLFGDLKENHFNQPN